MSGSKIFDEDNKQYELMIFSKFLSNLTEDNINYIFDFKTFFFKKN